MPTQTYGPGTSPSSQSPSEPKWTTGQGIGFLVSFVGWMLAVLGFVSAVIIVGIIEADNEIIPGICGLISLTGVLSAIPGTIVFNRCKDQSRQLDVTTKG